eukprot:277364-Prorocentrum_minimum.AAC.1
MQRALTASPLMRPRKASSSAPCASTYSNSVDRSTVDWLVVNASAYVRGGSFRRRSSTAAGACLGQGGGGARVNEWESVQVRQTARVCDSECKRGTSERDAEQRAIRRWASLGRSIQPWSNLRSQEQTSD